MEYSYTQTHTHTLPSSQAVKCDDDEKIGRTYSALVAIRQEIRMTTEIRKNEVFPTEFD